jgi:DNA-binding MarR family transcriptional regulator
MDSVDGATHRALEALFGLELSLARYRTVVARRNGVTVPDLQLLSTLATGGGRATPRELALALHLSSGTVTSMLDRAENAGLVRRSPNPSDRRSVLVDMTTTGHTVTAALTRSLYDAIAGALPPQARSSIARAVNDLITAVDDHTVALDRAGLDGP